MSLSVVRGTDRVPGHGVCRLPDASPALDLCLT